MNTADITFTGWVDVIVNIREKNNCGSVHVLFLVTTEKLKQLILGFNAFNVIMDSQKITEAGKDVQHLVQIQYYR